MIQWIAKASAAPAARRAPVLLLIALLNLALIPCTMAFAAVEEGHDCCPPELNLEALECCEVDDANVDKRHGLLKPSDSQDFDDFTADPADSPVPHASVRPPPATDPPDPPERAESRHKLHCIYLI